MDKIIGLLEKYFPMYLEGLWGTLWLSAVTVVLGTVLGMFVALLRMGKVKVFKWIADAYIEVLRGTPTLLQLYFFWIGLPKLLPFLSLSDTACILVAMTVNASAYISEIIRAGIGAVDRGQWEAVKNILPALCNEFISTIKGTSLASVFFVGELMTAYKTVASATFLQMQSLLIAGVIYFTITFTLSKLLKLLERRLTVSD